MVYQGDVRQRDKVARLTEERRQGGHARRVMTSYERWLGAGEELRVLRLVGLFDRPAEAEADLVVSDPVQAGTMAVMAIADTAHFDLDKLRGRRY